MSNIRKELDLVASSISNIDENMSEFEISNLIADVTHYYHFPPFSLFPLFYL